MIHLLIGNDDSVSMIDGDGKTCTGCSEYKAYDEYSLLSSASDGRQVRCKGCNNAYAKKHYEEHKESITQKARWNHLKYRFGLTREQYETQLANQGGVCAICRTSEPGGRGDVFMVDHDHACCPDYRTCGECVRGLLCNDCNTGLARFQDSPKLMQEAAWYLYGAQRDRGIQLAKAVI